MHPVAAITSTTAATTYTAASPNSITHKTSIMRRSIFSARPARSLGMSLGSSRQQHQAAARRTFASIPTKDITPPSPIEPSKEQAHPIGPFYEAILNTPQPIPPKKPEVPPVSSHKSDANAPASAPAPGKVPAPAPEQQPAKAPEPATKLAAAPAATPTAPAKAAAATSTETVKAAVEATVASVKATATKVQDAFASSAAPTPAKRGRKPKEPKSVAPSSSSSSLSPSSTSSPSSSLSPLPPILSTSSNSSLAAIPAAEKEDQGSNDMSPQARARVVFGSSLAGPAERAERLAAIRDQSRLIAGVLVPPKPEEPDNCCMSGCVNCVWDRFRDDMEDWATANSEAERRLRAEEAGEEVGVTDASMAATEDSSRISGATAMSMDDDGGGSIGNWDAGIGASSPAGKVSKGWDEELYKNVPVGIREFMKQEKRLKEKHLREGTVG
ncbi:oxidoreductase-like protein [Podospora didyma]|uniref:Oxidoreductase-like protein n=1 Tax=Podospora didyma TaxID=330526 RepID=A0AAE0NI04_9PEZI|nr:oxidoreductase-like protein [Podospora didyma]